MRYVLIGGGPAAVWAAVGIRERDPEGSICLIGREHHPPYDKPPLSKQFLLDDEWGAEDASSKAEEFYAENHVQLRTGVAATRIDRAARTVTLEDGSEVAYDRLLLATGAGARPLAVPGADLAGVFSLRTVDDAEAIRQAIRQSRRAVMVGAGYIGLEVAAVCAQRGLDVTVVDLLDRPYALHASPAVSGFLQKYAEARGVRFVLGTEVVGFSGARGGVNAVQTRDGAAHSADFAVVGVGAILQTDLAKDAGLTVDDRGGVVVDSFLQTSDPQIWAAGDIACFEDVVLGRRWHAEHHLNAKWQGRAAGANMDGAGQPYDQVPYFYTDKFDIHLIQRGDPQAGGNATLFGDLDGGEFIELTDDGSGHLAKGVAVSHDEPALDAISDTLAELIRDKTPVPDITAATFGR